MERNIRRRATVWALILGGVVARVEFGPSTSLPDPTLKPKHAATAPNINSGAEPVPCVPLSSQALSDLRHTYEPPHKLVPKNIAPSVEIERDETILESSIDTYTLRNADPSTCAVSGLINVEAKTFSDNGREVLITKRTVRLGGKTVAATLSPVSLTLGDELYGNSGVQPTEEINAMVGNLVVTEYDATNGGSTTLTFENSGDSGPAAATEATLLDQITQQVVVDQLHMHMPN